MTMHPPFSYLGSTQPYAMGIRSFLLSLMCCTSLVGLAQSGSVDLSDEADLNDRTRQAMFNLQNPNAVLSTGGAFYVSNPAAAAEVDIETAYQDPTFRSFTVILQNGAEYVLPGRIRLLDQKIEVRLEDGDVYDLDNQMIQAVITPQQRIYVSSFDLMGRIKGTQLYEVAYIDSLRRLLVNTSTVWEDPPPKNMFDTSEPRKTLKQVERVYYIGPRGSTEVKRIADLLTALNESKNGPVGQIIKKRRLKNDVLSYVTLLESTREDN